MSTAESDNDIVRTCRRRKVVAIYKILLYNTNNISYQYLYVVAQEKDFEECLYRYHGWTLAGSPCREHRLRHIVTGVGHSWLQLLSTSSAPR